MKQIEITVEIDEKMENAVKKLKKLGFDKIRESDVYDIYMTQYKKDINSNNIKDMLSKSVLLRSLKVNGEEIKKITYKRKEYDKGNLISEQKIDVCCDDLVKSQKLFESLEFEKLIDVKYHFFVMAKDGMELAFQDVENLGILIEYESNEDFSNKASNEIINEKIKMYNQIKEIGIKIKKEIDIQKAYELIKKEYNL